MIIPIKYYPMVIQYIWIFVTEYVYKYYEKSGNDNSLNSLIIQVEYHFCLVSLKDNMSRHRS